MNYQSLASLLHKTKPCNNMFVSFAVSHISSCFSSSSSKFANISQHMLNQWLTTMNPYVWKAQILANLHMWAKSLRVIGPHQPKKKYVYSLLYIPISPLLLLSLLPSLSLPFLPPFPLLFKRKDKSFGYHNYQKKAYLYISYDIVS